MKSIRERAVLAALFLILGFLFVSPLPHGKEMLSRRDYVASFSLVSEYGPAFEGETFDVKIKAENKGRAAWASQGSAACFLSYHWLDKSKKVLRYDNPRSPLPRQVLPGERIALTVKVKSPLEAGSYVLEIDLLIEGLTWFKDRGSKTLLIPVRVSPRKWPEDNHPLTLENGPFTKFTSNLSEFNTLLKLIRITLKYNEVAFRGKTGRVEGFSAGAEYPQIWLRDANTVIPASRYFYPACFLFSWLDEHLALQKPDGSLFDWVDSRGVTDKNTVATDQEASAVLAASQISELLFPDWPAHRINDVPALCRLEGALEFVLKTRFDKEFGLITGAHTADWGDVDMNQPDQRAVYIDGTTHWTADIYDQSMFIEAANDLALLFEKASEPDKARLWRGRADRIRRNADKWLWQEDRGFYRVHIHLDSLRHEFNEDDIFAMGGNCQALISGLAGPPEEDKGRRIIEQALARQEEFGISTLAGCLLPPYPKGAFKHPAVDEPYEYQNGGQWDWFGAKLVLEMFERGFSRQARNKLLEITRKDIANGGFYEWDTKNGSGRGSDYFSGSAGSLARALIEGYFGIKLSKFRVALSPRLGTDEARIHVYLPAAECFVAYDYRIDRAGKEIRFSVNSDIGGSSSVRILNPWSNPGKDPSIPGRGAYDITRDGVKVRFRLERVYQDEYFVLETDLKNRSLVIRYLRPIE